MIVYLTGGIGTGKSTVRNLFAALGAPTIAADDIVRDLYTRSDVQAQIAAALGMSLPLDRQSIAAVVFNDVDARRRLERILHPLVASEFEAWRAQQEPEPAVYELPLLPAPQSGDTVIAVTAPLRSRLERLLAKGLTMEQAERRIAAQPSPEEYGKHADRIIVNDGDLDGLRRQVTTVWEELRSGPGAV